MTCACRAVAMISAVDGRMFLHILKEEDAELGRGLSCSKPDCWSNMHQLELQHMKPHRALLSWRELAMQCNEQQHHPRTMLLFPLKRGFLKLSAPFSCSPFCHHAQEDCSFSSSVWFWGKVEGHCCLTPAEVALLLLW